MEHPVLYTDAAGETHFTEARIELAEDSYAPPAPPFGVSSAFPASHLRVWSMPPEWFGDWHPSPVRQFVFIVSGEVELEASDGGKRRFGPGSLYLLEDTTGKGHILRVPGPSGVVGAFVQL